MATVSSKGVVKAKKIGKSVIKAKYNKKTYKCNITVKKIEKEISTTNEETTTPQETTSVENITTTETTTEETTTVIQYKDDVDFEVERTTTGIDIKFTNYTKEKCEIVLHDGYIEKLEDGKWVNISENAGYYGIMPAPYIYTGQSYSIGVVFAGKDYNWNSPGAIYAQSMLGIDNDLEPGHYRYNHKVYYQDENGKGYNMHYVSAEFEVK